jgi:hypothetical protein
MGRPRGTPFWETRWHASPTIRRGAGHHTPRASNVRPRKAQGGARRHADTERVQGPVRWREFVSTRWYAPRARLVVWARYVDSVGPSLGVGASGAAEVSAVGGLSSSGVTT